MIRVSLFLLLSSLFVGCTSSQIIDYCPKPRWENFETYEFSRNFEGCGYMDSWEIDGEEYKCLDKIPRANIGEIFVLYHYYTFGSSQVWMKNNPSGSPLPASFDQCQITPEGLEDMIISKCFDSKTNPNYKSEDEYRLVNYSTQTFKRMVYFPSNKETYALGVWSDSKNQIVNNWSTCMWEDSQGEKTLEFFTN